jgi:hypothetical protein
MPSAAILGPAPACVGHESRTHLLAVCKPPTTMHPPPKMHLPPAHGTQSAPRGAASLGLAGLTRWAATGAGASMCWSWGGCMHLLAVCKPHACMHACMQAPCNAQVCGGMRCHQPGEAGDPPRCIVRRHHHRLKRWALAGVAGGASICSQLVAHVWQAGSRLLQLAIKQACRLKQQHTVWCHQHIAGWRRPSSKQASKQASKHASKQQQHITDDCAAVCMCCG